MRIRELRVGFLFAIAIAVLACAPSAASGATLAVPADFPTIQQAIDAAALGDIVQIAPGTYVENIRFHGKAITVRGAGADLTTIDGSALTQGADCGSTVIFLDGEGPTSVLEDVTVTGGTGCWENPSGSLTTTKRGGGIIGWLANPTLRDVTVTGNSMDVLGYGGGAYFKGIPGPLEIVGCRFTLNTSAAGAGIVVDGPGELVLEDTDCTFNNSVIDGAGAILSPRTLTVRRCRFNDNATGSAGGFLGGGCLLIHIDPTGNPETESALFEDCEFSRNLAYIGAGFTGLLAPTTFRRCRFEENQAATIAAAALDSMVVLFDRCVFRGNISPTGRTISTTAHLASQLTFDHCTLSGEDGPGIETFGNPLLITHSVFWGNTGAPLGGFATDSTIEWSDIEGGYPGTGNIDADPLFVDAASGDLHLLAGSPCIDAGSPAYPFDPDGSTSDLGAFPFDGFGGFRRGDANTDGGTDIADGVSILLALFGSGFTLECADAADTNDDGAVDAADAIYTFQYQLLGGAPPPPPNDCGEDPTEDGLDCALGLPGC